MAAAGTDSTTGCAANSKSGHLLRMVLRFAGLLKSGTI
jgi:hypothetical protein